MALISGYACDNCHEMVLYDDSFFSRWEKPPTKIYLARKDGWSVGKRGVLCPNCRKDKRRKDARI